MCKDIALDISGYKWIIILDNKIEYHCRIQKDMLKDINEYDEVM